jgi:hypothetical protein
MDTDSVETVRFVSALPDDQLVSRNGEHGDD